MSTYPTLDLKNLATGHNGPPIPESQRIFFQERWRGRFFDFLRGLFEQEEAKGLTQAKLARRIGRPAEVVNRWLSAPSNLTLDSISDLMLGICAAEPEIAGSSLLNRKPRNYVHLDDESVSSTGNDHTPISPKEAEPTNDEASEFEQFGKAA